MKQAKTDHCLRLLKGRTAVNPIAAADLAMALGFTSTQGLRRFLLKLKRAGHLIASWNGQPHGYYLPANREQAFEAWRTQHDHALSTLQSIKPLARAMRSQPEKLDV